MFRVLLIIVLVFGREKGTTEAHVYCQDSHATDWTPLGYSCPIICASVVEAVKKLKELEYDDWLTSNSNANIPISKQLLFNMTELNMIRAEAANGKKIKPNEDDKDNAVKQVHRLYDALGEDLDPLNLRNNLGVPLTPSPLPLKNLIEESPPTVTAAHLLALYKMLMNKQSGSELQMVFKMAVNKLNKPCRKISYDQCARRSAAVQDETVKAFTAVLNKHSPDSYFTYEMGKALLTKILETQKSHQLGKFDVARIINILGKLMEEKKKDHHVAPRHIVLKSKFCLNVYVPGCFCIPGYVEKNGQCVRPQDCFHDPTTIMHLLDRITIE